MRRSNSVHLSAVVLGVLITGCGGDGGGGSGGTVLFEIPSSGSAFSMHKAPWPNDIFLGADGHPDFTLEWGTEPQDRNAKANITAALKEQDGWGVSSGAFFWTGDDEVDKTTLTDANAYIVDLGTGEKLDAIGHVRVDPPAVVLNPAIGVVFNEKSKYAFVLSSGVKTVAGKSLGASSDLEDVLEAADGATSSNPNRAKANAAYAPFRAWMKQKNVTIADLSGVSVVTTKSIRKDLDLIHGRIDALTNLKMTVKKVVATPTDLDALFGATSETMPGSTSTGALPHDAIGLVVHGSFKSPSYIHAEPGKNGIFEYDGAGPKQKGEDEVPFVLALPQASLAGSYANLPIVIFQHGINADRSSVLQVANELCRVGIAVIGMDLPFHGSRFIGNNDRFHAFADGAAGADDLPDSNGLSPSLKYTNIIGDGDVQFDPRAIRANFLQASVDHMTLTHLLIDGEIKELKDKANLPELTFRTDRLAYGGISFGSITGTVTLGAEPHIGAGFLSVGGGGLLFPLLVNSPVYGPYFMLFINGAASLSEGEVSYITDPPQFHPVYQLFQMTIDGGDAIAWAPYVFKKPTGAPKHVAMQVALLDESVPNEASEHLAGGFGIPVISHGDSPTPHTRFAVMSVLAGPLTANLTAGDAGASKVTGGMAIYKTAGHGFLVNRRGEHKHEASFPPFVVKETPVPITNQVVQAQKQLVTFMKTYIDTGMPTLIDPYL